MTTGKVEQAHNDLIDVKQYWYFTQRKNNDKIQSTKTEAKMWGIRKLECHNHIAIVITEAFTAY